MRLSEKSITSLIVVLILATLAMLIKDKNYFHKPPSVSYCKIDTIAVSKDLIFPYVHCKDSIAELKINAKLQLFYLHKMIGNDKSNIFSKLNENKKLKKFFFEILNNDKGCLTISFTKIGSYKDFHKYYTCDTNITYINFNPRTGDEYRFSEFIDFKSRKEFAYIVSKQVIEEYFKSTNDKYNDSLALLDIKNYFYNNFSQAMDYKFYLNDNELYIETTTKIAPKKSITFTEMTSFRVTCYDTIKNRSYYTDHNINDEKYIKIPKYHLKKCFNSLGQSFLNKSDDLKFLRTNSPYYLLISTIASKSVLLFCLKNELYYENNKYDYKPLSFVYLYDYCKNEGLFYHCNKFDNNKITMEEEPEVLLFESPKINRNTLEFEQHGDTLIGTWISADKKKKLPFWAKRL